MHEPPPLWRQGLVAAIDDLRDFDWNELGGVETIGAWPTIVMLLLGLSLFVACLGAGYWLDIRQLRAEVQRLGIEESELLAELTGKAALAADLEVRRGQTAEMEASFAALLRQLPGQSEMPALLEDISAAAQASGLQLASIELRDELEQDHYLELPIAIELSGGYHDFGRFISAVASLPRIVTLHDFSIEAGEEGLLGMALAVRTYRYKPEEGR